MNKIKHLKTILVHICRRGGSATVQKGEKKKKTLVLPSRYSETLVTDGLALMGLEKKAERIMFAKCPRKTKIHSLDVLAD